VQLLGYVRVSRVGGREGDSFISPGVQRDQIMAWAKAQGHSVEFLPDELDQSGSNAGRPVFNQALDICEAGGADGIIVAKLDRFARSHIDAALAIRRLEESGAELISVGDQLDTSTPVGKFARTMMLAIAELERDRIRASWATAQEEAVRRGIHIASRVPTGYKRGADRRLEPDVRAAGTVADAFRWRARGKSYREIATLLEKRSVRGPYDNQHWTTAAVAKLLANPVYLGQARSGRHVCEDAHPAIVTRPEWEAAQGVKTIQPARSEDGALLAGILRCAGCRYVLKPDTMLDANTLEHLRNYRCRGDHAAGKCPSRASSLGRVIEPYVVEQFLAAVGSGVGEAVIDEEDLAAAQAEVDEAEAELAAWVTTVSVRSLGADVYKQGIDARQQRVEAARRALGAVARSSATAPPVNVRDIWPELSTAERRELLASTIDAVILRRGRVPLAQRVHILWRGEMPEDFPRRGRRVPLASFDWPADSPRSAGVSAA